jgi:hypothetical protein
LKTKIYSTLKNGLAYNAGVVAVNSNVSGEIPKCSGQRDQGFYVLIFLHIFAKEWLFYSKQS